MQQRSWLMGTALCFTTVVIYGIQFPVAGLVMKHLNPFDFTTIRYGSAAILFVAMLAAIEGKRGFQVGARWMGLWWYGSCGFAGYSFLVFGGQRMLGDKGPFVAAVMMALMPLLTAIVQRVQRGARLRGYTIASMVIALVGVLVVITNGQLSALFALGHSIVADVMILVGALMWVLYTIGGSRFPDWSPIRYTTLSTVFGMSTVLVLTILLHTAGALHPISLTDVAAVKWPIVYMILCAGVVALFSWNTGNYLIGNVNSVLFMNLIPVTTLIVNGLQGVPGSLAQWIGAAIVVCALVANNFMQRMSVTVTAPLIQPKTTATP